MTEYQERIYKSIINSRPRTGISGPFGPWLSVPQIADPAQNLGRACRYETSLSFRESELVILLTGARHRSHAEFDIHVGEALKAGISMMLIESIPRDDEFSVKAVEDRVLPFLLESSTRTSNDKDNKDNDGDSAREVAIVRFVSELLGSSTVKSDTYNATKTVLGEDSDKVLVEITSIVGYYTFCAYTLNVFNIPTKVAQGE